MIEQVPVWAWWVCAGCLIVFTAALLKIIVWFLGRFIDENKESWKEIKIQMTKMTDGISDLVILTTKHEERIEHQHRRLNHHDEEIVELRSK